MCCSLERLAVVLGVIQLDFYSGSYKIFEDEIFIVSFLFMGRMLLKYFMVSNWDVIAT
jgi:hypothetical protein